MKTIKIIILIVLLLVVVYWFVPTDQGPMIQPQLATSTSLTLTTVAENLDTPWEIAFLPNGDLLAAERPGRLRTIGSTQRVIDIPGVVETSEGGFMGIALHPNFATNKFLYVYSTVVGNKNQVTRYVFDGVTLTGPTVIIDSIPAASNHNGGRIAFGPDGYLYATTGDAGREDLAQDTKSLAGKILRVTDEGKIPADNPFGNTVYSYGHRNPQGLAWDAQGRLWSNEHGRSGVQSGYDEVNLIEKGGNYGWPVVQGDEARSGMKLPALHSGPSTTWAPAGLAFKDNSLYFTGLRGAALYRVPITESGTLGELQQLYKNTYGRLRAVSVDKNNVLYFSTSNRDGRGRPIANDDRIFKLSSF